MGILRKLIAGEGGTYMYYDTPDGKDVPKKLWYTSKVAGTLGLGWSIYDVMFYSRFRTIPSILGRTGYLVFLFVAPTAAFTTVTFMATRLRNKDGPLNYVYGGTAAGIVLGGIQQSIMKGFLFSCAFSIVGAVFKDCIMKGYEIWPLPPDSPIKAGLDVNKMTLYPVSDKVYWKVSEDD